MRRNSDVSFNTGGIGANRTVLIAGETRVVPQRVRTQGFLQRAPHPSIGRLDEDGADPDAPVGDDAAVVANQESRIKVIHHLRSDTLIVPVAALSVRFGADAKRGQNLEPRPGVPVIS